MAILIVNGQLQLIFHIWIVYANGNKMRILMSESIEIREFNLNLKRQFWKEYNSGLSLALVHSSTKKKSVWASEFWKPIVHTHMSKILIFKTKTKLDHIDTNRQ